MKPKLYYIGEDNKFEREPSSFVSAAMFGAFL